MARLWRDFEGEPFLINPGGELAIFNRPRHKRRRRKIRARRRKHMARTRVRRRRRRVRARRRVYRVRHRRRVYHRRRRRNVPAFLGALAANRPRRRRRRRYTRNYRRHRRYHYRRNPAIFGPLDTEALIGGAGSALLVHYATVPLAQMVGVQERFGLKFRGVQALTGIGSGFLAGYFKLVPRSWVGAWVAGSVAMVTLDLLRDWNAGLLKLSYYDYRGGDMARSVRGMRGFRGVIPESVGDKYNESVSDSYVSGGFTSAGYGETSGVGYYRVGR